MKNFILALLFFLNWNAFAQKPCELDSDIKDSIGTYKSTKQYQIFERSFAGNSTNIFFALTNTNGIIGVEAQVLQRSNEFLKASCFGAFSKIFIQLQNGKIVTLLYAGKEDCGTLIRDDKNMNNRILTGTFLFAKENYQDLKVSPVTLMRISYSSDNIVDYPFKTGFVSELDKKMYQPETYFMQYLKCIDN